MPNWTEESKSTISWTEPTSTVAEMTWKMLGETTWATLGEQTWALWFTSLPLDYTEETKGTISWTEQS